MRRPVLVKHMARALFSCHGVSPLCASTLSATRSSLRLLNSSGSNDPNGDEDFDSETLNANSRSRHRGKKVETWHSSAIGGKKKGALESVFSSLNDPKGESSADAVIKEGEAESERLEEELELAADTVDGERKSTMLEIVSKFESEYSRMADSQSANIASRAASLPGFKHVYCLQLRHPHNARCKVHLIGIRQQSIVDQMAIAKEIRAVIDAIEPSVLIAQCCKERYDNHISAVNVTQRENLPIDFLGALNPNHFSYTGRFALYLVNALTQGPRANLFGMSVVYASELECVHKLVLGDVPLRAVSDHYDDTLLDYRYRYISNTTIKQRRNYGDYPGVREILFGFNSVKGVNEWIALNKSYIRSKERRIFQFAQDMQYRLKYGQQLLDNSAKSMAYYAFREGMVADSGDANADDGDVSENESEEANEQSADRNVLVLCNVFTMLSIPLHFGKVSTAEMVAMRASKTRFQRKVAVFKRWTLNYWTGICWSVCGVHSVLHAITNQPIDYSLLLQFGVLLPVCYPISFALLAIRARMRVRRLHILMKRSQVSDKLTQKLTVS